LRPPDLHDHPTRAAILEELHARPVEFVASPGRVRRVALLLERHPDAVPSAQRRFAEWCGANGIGAPPAGSRQHTLDVGERRVTWELHTEFVTLTWASSLEDGENWPLGIGIEALGSEKLIACMRLDIIDAKTIPDRILSGFAPASLSVSSIEGGEAQVATDFVPDADSFTRFELAGGGIGPLRRAIVVRRLLEIETYRTLALLGLPLAREISPAVTSAEADLEAAVQKLGTADDLDEAQDSLAALHALSVRSGQLVERTSYRFAASHAYGDIMRRRLRGLDERSLQIGSTLDRYLGNRIDPALATCLAVEKRQLALSEKIERAIELLNTRISLDIQTQNKSVLDTIASTARSQFRLQRTVEGLSTIAISYYLLGIVGYVLEGLGEYAHFSKPLAVAIAAPFVLLLVWLAIRTIRRQHFPE
jgi:uncharacterized membrane-anchored protein